MTTMIGYDEAIVAARGLLAEQINDRQGWSVLAHAPVGGWPAGEIIDAMCESGLDAVIPIDIVGMVTDRNPQGLYLPENA
jgi:hypothetical protein